MDNTIVENLSCSVQWKLLMIGWRLEFGHYSGAGGFAGRFRLP
jgi:hypothetical protein